MKNIRFEFRLDPLTAEELTSIAQRWRRSQADVLRILICAAAKLVEAPGSEDKAANRPESEGRYAD